MTVEQNHDAKTQGEAPTWAWPVYAFVAWLATILGYVARFKRIRRTHRFRQDWRDSWEDLREAEWLRDQLIAQGVAQLLAGQPLQLDDTKIELTPSSTYGGPCPRTPFEMNRRFLALARWAADPEAIIRARFKRLAKHEINNPHIAHGSTDARSAATHEAVRVFTRQNSGARVALMVSSDPGLDPGERPSNHEGVLTKARGPPQISMRHSRPAHNLSARASETAPARPIVDTSILRTTQGPSPFTSGEPCAPSGREIRRHARRPSPATARSSS